MSALGRYIVCYDIPDDKRRRNVAQLLDGLGDRMQESVFEVLLDRTLLDGMVVRLGGLIEATEDRVAIYPLCSACDGRRVDLGLSISTPRPGQIKAIIA